MPRLDRTGPTGAGPMTGGARGFCGSAASGYPRPHGKGMGLGRGFRGGYGAAWGTKRGFGRGFGWCRWYPPAYGSDDPFDQTYELNALKAEADVMKNSLEAINERIAAMEKSSE